MTKKVISLLFAAALFVPTVGSAAAAGPKAEAMKIGVVDFQRCLYESKTGKKFKSEFTAKAQQAQADLEKKEAALKELRDQLEKQGLVLSPAARAEKEKEYREKVDAFKEQVKTIQQALQREDQEVTNRIMRELQALVRKLGEAGGYTLIVERQEGGALYFAKDADLTDEVIRRYDQESEQKGKAEERK